MAPVLDRGNAYLNGFVREMMAVQPDDRVLEIGCGTGKLIQAMAAKITSGRIEGVDFSSEMVALARKRNRKYISHGTVAILEADFAESIYTSASYTKACSVNGLYFWNHPDHILKKTMDLLKPGGRFILAFEDIDQLKRKNLSADVFRLYTRSEVLEMLASCGASGKVAIETRERKNQLFHCAVAIK